MGMGGWFEELDSMLERVEPVGGSSGGSVEAEGACLRLRG